MKESRCQQIENILRQKLRSMHSGDKIPTEMELCTEFSVSRMTMNKVITKLVDDDLLYRIKKKGTFVKDKRTPDRPIYFLLPVVDFLAYESSRHVQRMLRGLNAEASRHNRTIEFVPATRTNQPDDYDWETLEKIPHGSQVFAGGFWFRKLFPFLKKKECEVVCLNGDLWLEPELRKILSSWYTIKIERRIGTENAIAYLAKTGRRKPVLFYEYQEKEHPVTEGFKSGLAKAGLEFSPERFIYMKNIDETCLQLKTLHKITGFDSIVLVSATATVNICDALEKIKLRIPDDISVISLDEQSILADMKIPVSSMASPLSEVGREAARVFQREVFLPGETRLHQLLIERESTRKGAGSASQIDFSDETRTPEVLLRFGTDGI